MTGQAHWLTAALPILGLLWVTVLLWHTHAIDRHYHTWHRRFFCSRMGKRVDAELVQVVGHGGWVGVRSCTAFPDPENVHCEKECLEALAHEPSLALVHTGRP